MAPPIPDRSGAPDAEIVQLVREGETDAFAELVRRTRRPAYRLALRIARDHQDADGVLQESYVKAYRALHRFDPSRPFGPWMLTIVARTALSPSLRAAHRAVGSFDDAPDIERAFAKLPEEHRAIIALRVEGDLPYAEIAEALGVPVGTVMSGLARAREALLEESRKVAGATGEWSVNDEPLHPPRAELFGYRDGELPAEKRVLIEAHVVGCSACRALIDEVSGMEAALRRIPREPAADYYERLPGAILERLAGGAPDESRAGDAKREEPAVERRRSGDDSRHREPGRIGAPPRFPLVAVISTVSAAAAVVVVVILLVRQGAFRRPVSPPPPAVEKQETPGPAPRAAAPADTVAPVLAPAFDGSGGAYSAILQKFGLPSVWSQEVRPEALERAEQELRYLYQRGLADTDSARVRLYLAEAARLRYVPGQDTTLYDRIVHHYRRAIRLEEPGGDVGKVAQERLGTLQP